MQQLTQSELRLNQHLARSTAGNILALAALLATSDLNTAPVPTTASTRGAEDVDFSALAIDGAVNVVQGQTGDGDSVGGSTSWAAVLVVLLDDNPVFGDTRESDVLISDALDGAGSTGDGLDADTFDDISKTRKQKNDV